ncbi:hypothetical protein [uncultured Bradyrhizobium sp.]|uniref:hypothetical protein n=1 Tax=uncultured Bradyrhizobium sp. TaxID=199684 RepID=UPI0035C99955
MLDRGRDPCLSKGTLQLSIRCSSFHFSPSRSLPVRLPGALEGAGAGADVADGLSVAGRSCAMLGTALQIANANKKAGSKRFTAGLSFQLRGTAIGTSAFLSDNRARPCGTLDRRIVYLR